jgi:hypothetical protein
MNKHQNQVKIKITDLINESVDNAISRRQQALKSEEFEIDLSDDKNQNYSHIKGGFCVVKPPVILGYKPSTQNLQ